MRNPVEMSASSGVVGPGRLKAPEHSPVDSSTRREPSGAVAVTYNVDVQMTKGPALVAPSPINRKRGQMFCKFAAASLPRSLTTS